MTVKEDDLTYIFRHFTVGAVGLGKHYNFFLGNSFLDEILNISTRHFRRTYNFG